MLKQRRCEEGRLKCFRNLLGRRSMMESIFVSLQHGCFSVNSEELLRTAILNITYEDLLLPLFHLKFTMVSRSVFFTNCKVCC